MNVKICPLQIGKIPMVNYVITSQGKKETDIQVVRIHGPTVIIKNVKKHVENLATNAQVSSRLKFVNFFSSYGSKFFLS